MAGACDQLGECRMTLIVMGIRILTLLPTILGLTYAAVIALGWAIAFRRPSP